MFRIENVRVEYREKPIGLDVKKPRFSWILKSNKENIRQQSYHIIVKNKGETVWDSGLVTSEDSVLIEYAGKEIEPFTKYDVQIIVINNMDESANFKTTFESGLKDGSLIKGNWIKSTNIEKAPTIFRRKFDLNTSIKEARIYLSALGVYELELNNNKVGEEYFSPGWTSYHNRLQYQTYDITKELQKNNQIDITVGNGWYKGIFGFAGEKNHYGDQVATIAMVRIVYDNGDVDILGTDETWTCHTGKIRYSEIYMGEVVDSSFEEDYLGYAQLLDYSKDILVSQESEPVRITKELKAIKKIVTPKKEIVLDFGQILTGFVRVKTNQSKGTKMKIRHAEVLDKEGNFYTDNLRTAISEDTFISNGQKETFQPKFTFHGFRYICIEGFEENWSLEDFTACVLHTDMRETGSFESSNPKVNQLQHNIQWGQRGNFLDIPTDCPQRDERLGWTGDAQVFASTASYNFDSALFFTKWLNDLKAEQTKEFGVPHVIPNILNDQEGAAGWSDAATIIPWTLYQIYGDKRILENQYESMRAWVEYIRSKTDDKQLWQKGYQYGDWVALDKEESSDRIGATDVYLIATAYYAYSTSLVKKAAEVLGLKEDAEAYDKLYKTIVNDFNDEYVTKNGRLVSETQTGCILALHFSLVEEKHRPRVLESLIENLAKHNNHLVTGFIGTPYLCHTLTDNNYHEIAGKVFLKEDYPSWLYSVNLGATTIWERWDSMKPDGSFDESGMNSFNHYANGSVGDWMYKTLAGIQLIDPGYKRIQIKPELIQGISWVKASFESPYGTIKSNWTCENGKIEINVEIPVNTDAEIWLPGTEEKRIVGSGSYTFSYETNISLEKERFSQESTLKEILSQPKAVELLNTYSPGMTDNEMLQFVYNKSISELNLIAGPETAQLFDMVITKLNLMEEDRCND